MEERDVDVSIGDIIVGKGTYRNPQIVNLPKRLTLDLSYESKPSLYTRLTDNPKVYPSNEPKSAKAKKAKRKNQAASRRKNRK